MTSECPICENYRFIVIEGEPMMLWPCQKCNWRGQYKLKEIDICLGCGQPSPCKSDCPCGTGKCLVKQ
jgi:hypothetical protein